VQALAVADMSGQTSGMKQARLFADVLAPLIDLVYPPRCPLCGEGLDSQNGVCADCWTELVIPGEPSCALCQRPFNTDTVTSEAICAPCLGAPPQHDGIAAATLYNDASRRLVLSFKHGRRIALSKVLGRMMASRISGLDGDWLIVPVPLHRWRLWSRGFNQAVLLAREIAIAGGRELIVDGLARTKLGGLGRKARSRELSGAISINTRRTKWIKGAQILLVDDVLTSGATSDSCVSALKKAGASKVVIVCFARVIDEARG
jgi:ComF family protein